MKLLPRAPVQIVMAVVLVAASAITSTGCMHVSIPNHPGSVNKVDNVLYDGILTLRTTILETQRQFEGNRGVLDQINQGILPGFNKLEESYKAYHTALVAGKDDTSTLAQLQAQLAAVRVALAGIIQAGTEKPGPTK